ncbi:MAG: hypothetical protein DHS80DRAFT_29241 [Piptocephalis tieghemiana]|nr:MAG: hypothetical protein DHS80DRAFT_29241 [Piptocephalis tieghemiana]
MRFRPASLENFPCAKPSSQGSISTPSQRKAARRYLEAMSKKSSTSSLRARSPPAGAAPSSVPPSRSASPTPPATSSPCRTRPSSVDLSEEPPVLKGIPLVMHSKSEGTNLDGSGKPQDLISSSTSSSSSSSSPTFSARTLDPVLPIPDIIPIQPLTLTPPIASSTPPVSPTSVGPLRMEGPAEKEDPLLPHLSPSSSHISIPGSPIRSEDEGDPEVLLTEGQMDQSDPIVMMPPTIMTPPERDPTLISSSLKCDPSPSSPPPPPPHTLLLDSSPHEIQRDLPEEVILEGELDIEESGIYDEGTQEDFHFIPSDCTDSSIEVEEEEEGSFQSQMNSVDEEGMDRLRLKYRYIRAQNQSLLRELEGSKATSDALRTVVETSEHHLISALERSSELEGRIRSLEASLKRERANHLAHASFRSTRRVLSPTRSSSSSSGAGGSDGAGSPRRLRSPTRRGAREEMSDLQRRRALLRERSRAREEEQKSWQEKLTRLTQRDERMSRRQERFNSVTEEEEEAEGYGDDEGEDKGMGKGMVSMVLEEEEEEEEEQEEEEGDGIDGERMTKGTERMLLREEISEEKEEEEEEVHRGRSPPPRSSAFRRRSYPSPQILRTSSPLSSTSSPEDGELDQDGGGEEEGEQSLVGIAVDMLSEMSALMEEPDYTPNTSLILS